MKEGINNPRAEINAIDAELLRLLNKRVEIALKVGEFKRRDDVSIRVAKRYAIPPLKFRLLSEQSPPACSAGEAIQRQLR